MKLFNNSASPKLLKITSYSTNSIINVEVVWESIKDGNYAILRKSNTGEFEHISILKARGKTQSYIDKIDANDNTDYVYSVCKVIGLTKNKYSDYDKNGLKLNREKIEFSTDIANTETVISIKTISGVDGYAILRKFNNKSKYELIDHIEATESSEELLTYTDVYFNSFSPELKKKLSLKRFIDPSTNGLTYAVCAYNKVDDKVLYYNYDYCGCHQLNEPVIVSADYNSSMLMVKWGVAVNADSYNVYFGKLDENGEKNFTLVANVAQPTGKFQSYQVEIEELPDFISVSAIGRCLDSVCESTKDENFSIKNRFYENNNILYIGDSITFGSPYKAKDQVEVFSYPNRVAQLTGAKYYNPSIPGSTYTYREHDLGSYHRYRLVLDVAKKIHNSETPLTAIHENSQSYKDFDIVVFAAGTNDYTDNSILGEIDSLDYTEFCGAFNTIMSYVDEGNQIRINEGKAPIKLVFVDLFFSDRIKSFYGKRDSRFDIKNDVGLTLTEYQNVLNELMTKYQNKGYETFRFDTSSFLCADDCKYKTTDNLHMTKNTYTNIGNEFADFLIANDIIKK